MLKKLLTAFLCLQISHSVMAGFSAQQMEGHLTTLIPQNASATAADGAKYPVVFFLQGSNGTNTQARLWAEWYAQYGIASVMIDSAGVRGMKRLFGIDYEADLAPALEAVQGNPHLDFSRYAVMGFSRGGTAALDSGTFLLSTQPKPDFVFALYPGDSGQCRNKYKDPTKVFVFYGALDDWGDYMGTRNACSRMPGIYGNASFHLLKDAHHGYDGTWAGKWQCCGNRTFTSEPNPEALQYTRDLILKEIQEKWGLGAPQ